MTNQNVVDFLKKYNQNKKTGRNRLSPYVDQIKYLFNNGVSYAGIANFLESEGVKVLPQTVGFFCRKNFGTRNKTKENINSTPVKQQINQIENSQEEEKVKSKNSRRVPAWATNIGGITSIDELI